MTPAATGTVIEPCALIVTEGVLVVVGEKVTVAATDELRVDALVGTAEQRILTENECTQMVYSEFQTPYSYCF